MSPQVELFKSTFNSLTSANVALLDNLYASNVVFADPFHHIAGLPALRAYFLRQYEGVIRCTFTFEEQVVQRGTAMLTWTMHLEHARISKGETIHLPGASHIRFTDKVTYHRDYFDAGEFLYERLPVVGGLIRAIKGRL
ncbi:MAG: nuclear transport factor 2 family protein [Nitrospira sp.]